MHTMKFYLFLILLKLISSNSLKCLHSPLSMKRYDQADLLIDDEDRREILKDYKTIFAPEYRIYTNDSICSTVTVAKRKSKFEDENCRDDIYKEYDPRRDFFSKSSRKGFVEDRLLYGKNMTSKQILKDLHINSDLLESNITGNKSSKNGTVLVGTNSLLK